MTDLSPFNDLLAYLRAAESDDCGIWRARRVVAARADRGDYEAVIQGEISADMREALAVALWKEVKGERNG